MEPGEAWLCAFATVLGLFSVAFPTSMNNFVARLLCIAQIAPATRALDAPRGARRRMVRGAHRRGRAIRPAAVGSGRGADHPAAFLAGQDKRAKFPTSKAPFSAVFHSFRLIFGRAIISRNGLEAWMFFPERARAEHSR